MNIKYQRAGVLVSERGLDQAFRVSKVRMRWEDQSSISFRSLVDLGRKPFRKCRAAVPPIAALHDRGFPHRDRALSFGKRGNRNGFLIDRDLAHSFSIARRHLIQAPRPLSIQLSHTILRSD
jgi:hypothetical protein